MDHLTIGRGFNLDGVLQQAHEEHAAVPGDH